MTRHAHRAALGLAFLAASLASHAVPEPDDIVGPPPYSINGCAANAEWTQPYLAAHFGVSERTIRRARTKLVTGATALCTLPYPQVEAVLARASGAKPGYDQPDKAYEFRVMSLRSDDGTIAEDGPKRAYEQRMQVISATKPKLGGLTPGTPFWTEIGPGNVGGRVRAILPLSPTRIVAGSVSGGLWLTENAGASWTVVRDMMPNVAITCLVPDTADASIIYVCTGEGFFNFDGVRGDGIYRITGANGAPGTWTITQLAGTTAAAGSQWRYVNRLVVLPQVADPGNVNNRLIVAATNSGLYRSLDGGTSFTQVRPGRHLDVKYHPLDWANLIAGTDTGGVSYSADRGATWNAVATTGLPVAGGARVEVYPVSTASPGATWLASVYVDGGQLWRSTNAGQAWSRRDVSGMSTSTTPAGGVLDQQGWYDNVLWSSPDGSRVIVGGVGIRLSVDGGLTFGVGNPAPTSYSYGAGLPGIHVDHHAIVAGTDFATTGTVFFGNDGGIYRATGLHTVATPNPGSIMTNLNNGLGITQFYGGAGGGSGPAFRIIGGTQDNGTRTWNGSAWSFTFGGDGGEGAVDPTNTQFVYGSIQNLGLFRSSNGGTSASYICSGITDADCQGVGTGDTNFIPPFTLDPNNSDRMLVGAQSLWRSNNVRSSSPGLPTWTAIKAPVVSRFCQANPGNSFCLPPRNPNTFINFVAVAPGNADIVWVGYNDGQLFTTTNGTAASPAWTANAFSGFAGAPTGSGRALMRILFDPSNLQRAWVSFGGYNTGNVARTTNGGATWTDVHGNLPASPVRTLARHPTTPDTIYAGTEVGIFASDVAGTTWSAQNEGPGTVSVEELFFTDSATLYASTHGRGMFRATVTPAASPGSVQFSTSTASVTEGQTVQLTVTRVGGTAGAASVNYATAGGTAGSGSDFTASGATLTWANAEGGSRTIDIPVATDALVEGTETFTVTLSAPSGASLGAPSVATVTINDPDLFPAGGSLPPGAWSQPTTTPAGAADPSIIKGWIVDANPANAFQGTQSLRSDAMPSTGVNGVFNRAAIELRTYTGAGNITFARKVGSEANFDFLYFHVDGVQQGAWSGNVPYSVVSFPVAAGMHTFRWTYEKDFSVDTAPDAAWIDSITLPGSGLDPAADTDNDGVPNGVELNEAINPTVKDNDVFAATPKGARLFAMQQYRDFLGREGDAGGISFYVNLLNTGALGRAQVAEAFFNSPEFQSSGSPIVRLYFAFFNRIPDHGGFTFQVNALRTGTPLTAIANNFALSPEFQATYGALGNSQYVTLLYQNVLGRTPVQAEVDFHVARLNAGVTRGEVMTGFSESPEYKALKGNGVYVTMMYEGLLRRAADMDGFNFWVNLMNTGTPGVGLIQGFLNSTEYRNRFLP